MSKFVSQSPNFLEIFIRIKNKIILLNILICFLAKVPLNFSETSSDIVFKDQN